MARWPKVRSTERDALFRELRLIDGSIARHEPVAIGKGELVALAMETGLEEAQAYRAVNTICAQPFMRHVGGEHHSATTVNSARAWFERGRLDLARRHRDELRSNFVEWGRLGGRPKGGAGTV